MTSLSDWLNSLPSTAWPALATVIASVIAGIIGSLIGVFVTNQGHNRRLKKQLQHDAIQRDREREMSLRREVYLKAAEAVTEANFVINQIINMDLQEIQRINPFLDLSKSLNKIHVVGKEKTIDIIEKYNEEFSKLNFILMNAKLDLDFLQLDINNIDKNIGIYQKVCEEILPFIQENQGNVEQSNRVYEMYKNYEGRIIAIENLVKEKNKKVLLIYKTKISLQQECQNHIMVMISLIVECNLAIREELDIKINEQFYRSLMDRRRRMSGEQVSQFIELCNSRISSIVESSTTREE
jgi:hypothetical protein